MNDLPRPALMSSRLGRRAMLGGAAGLALTPTLEKGMGTFPAAAATLKLSGDTAPLPPNAVGPPIPKKGYLVDELGKDLFWVTDGIYQMMFMVTQDGVVAVDAPPTLGNNILRAVREVTHQKVRHAVYSHAHADHVSAMSLYEDATFYSHVDVMHLLRRTGDANRPVPKKKDTFQRKHTLDVGGQRLELEYRGPNHAPGNLFIYAPEQHVLMLVDVIFPGWVPFAYLAVSADVPGWVSAHEKALDYPFRTLVGGHLTRLGTRHDVQVQQEYISELQSTAALELTNVDFNQIFASTDPANPWAIFSEYLDAVATRTAERMEPRWISRLGGVDVFTHANAWAMAESLRIDRGMLEPFGIHP